MMMTALPQPLNPSKNKFWQIKEWTRIMKEGGFKEWARIMNDCNRKMKDWEMMFYILRKNYIAYVILPP